MKYDYLILSTKKNENEAMELYKTLSEKGVKSITNADTKQRVKSLFDAVSNSAKILVLVPSEIDLDEDEQFFELLDGAYIEGANMNAVFVKDHEIPELLLLYLGRKDAFDIKEALEMEGISNISQESNTQQTQTSTLSTFTSSTNSTNENLISEYKTKAESQTERESELKDFYSFIDEILDEKAECDSQKGETIISQLSELSTAGDSDAIYYMGELHRRGILVEKNNLQATSFLEKAVALTHPNALYSLGMMYFHGEITNKNNLTGEINVEPTDYNKGWTLIKKAADLNNKEALRLLGNYNNPQIKERNSYFKNNAPDIKLAVIYYTKAAELMDAESMWRLGLKYAHGEGVFINKTLAFNYYLRSAELGDKIGMSLLGSSYAFGSGVDKSYSEAFYWLHKAAELEEEGAMYLLGRLYYEKDDLNMAEYWLKQALDRGYHDALPVLKEINPKKYQTGKEKFMNGLAKGLITTVRIANTFVADKKQ